MNTNTLPPMTVNNAPLKPGQIFIPCQTRRGWTHARMCAYHALRRRGFSNRIAARMALRDMVIVCGYNEAPK